MSLLLIPLCFIVDFIVGLGGNSHNGGMLFVLIPLNYTEPFFYRRLLIPTYISVIAFYVISILGAFLILFTSLGWGILVIIVLKYIYPFTTIPTEYGIDISKTIDEEEKDIKGIQFLATKSQRKLNTHGMYDTIIVIIFFVLFILAKEHIEDRYEMIEKNKIEHQQMIENLDKKTKGEK
jgi:ABC-type amino acid transport system permease subunit